MIDKIRNHVEFLFQNAPRSPRAIELKEELISNLIDRYSDLVAQGETEEAAFGIVIAGIGDVDELIRGLREQEVWDPVNIQFQQQRSALFISVAVGLFIVSIIFPITFHYFGIAFHASLLFQTIGFVLMVICIAFGVGLLVYNNRTQPKYVKMEETIVEDFKEWNVNKRNRSSLHKTIQNIIWTGTVPLYLILGVFFDAWHPGWLIFLLAPVVSQIVRLVLLYQEGE